MVQVVATTTSRLAREFSDAKLPTLTGVPFHLYDQAENANISIDPVTPWPSEPGIGEIHNVLSGLPLARIDTLGSDTRERNFVYATDNGKAAIVSVMGDAANVTLGLEKESLASTFVDLLDPISAAPPIGGDVKLDQTTAPVFFALLDHIRLLVISSIIQRTSLSAIAIRPGDILQQIRDGHDQQDNRWLSTIYSYDGRGTALVSYEVLPSALKELEAAGLGVVFEHQAESLFSPSMSTVGTALNLLNMLPMLSFHQVGADDVDPQPTDVLIHGKSLWHLQLTDEDVKLTSIDGLQAIRLILDRLPANLRYSPDAHGNAGADGHCLNCGASFSAEEKFCTQCGNSR